MNRSANAGSHERSAGRGARNLTGLLLRVEAVPKGSAQATDGTRGQPLNRKAAGLRIALGLAMLPAVGVSNAGAASYTVGNCASDPTNYNTQAFGDFATR